MTIDNLDLLEPDVSIDFVCEGDLASEAALPTRRRLRVAEPKRLGTLHAVDLRVVGGSREARQSGRS